MLCSLPTRLALLTEKVFLECSSLLQLAMSSIFGQPKPTGAPFGNMTTSPQSQPTQTGSVFGNPGALLPQQSAAPTTSLFGNIGASQPQQPTTSTPSLFTNLEKSQPQQTSSLFANLGSTSQPQQQPSFFGNAGGQQASTSGAGGGILAPAKPAATNFFGTASNAISTQPADTSLFAPQQQQKDSQSGQTAQGQQPQQDRQLGQTGANSASQPAYFDSLLEKGKKRAHDADGGPGFNDLPSLQLGLGEIAKRVRELGGVGMQAQGRRGTDSRAHYLLAASGINPGNTRRDLDSLAAQSLIAGTQSPPNWDPDTHKYVEQLQEQSTLKMISEGLERAQRNFDSYLEENVDINWELQRKKIYEHFGLMPNGVDASSDHAASPNGKGGFGKSERRPHSAVPQTPLKAILNRSVFGQSSLQKSVIGTPGTGPGNASLFADVAEWNGNASEIQDDRFLRERQRKYAEKVQALNRARLDESQFPVLQQFKSVECQPGAESPRQIADSYDALIEIAGESQAKERQYADEYLQEAPNSAQAVKIRKKIINGSRRCLERAFLAQLEGIVAKNPKEAHLGGVPTTINRVRAYIRIRAARKDLIPDGVEMKTIAEDYCWALVFFLLRCGLVKEAADYVVENATAFKTIDRSLVNYITDYAKSHDGRLSRKNQDGINREYSKHIRVAPDNQIDPYQLACYKVIGRCELSKRSIEGISQGVEDWVWLQFALAREVNRAEENAGDVFGLEDVRNTIREIGERHFATGGGDDVEKFGTFFFLQILGGMFEQAVSYLYSYSYVAAVHFAIALNYYGLLRVSDFSFTETELCE